MRPSSPLRAAKFATGSCRSADLDAAAHDGRKSAATPRTWEGAQMARGQDRGVLADRAGKVTVPADDDVADVAVRPQPDAASGLGHAGRVLIATFGTWLAFVAIPGAPRR